MKKEAEKIEFPRLWEFRLIAVKELEQELREALLALGNAEKCSFQIDSGENSRSGKYLSLRLSCQVDSLEKANFLASEMGKLPGVKFMI